MSRGRREHVCRGAIAPTGRSAVASPGLPRRLLLFALVLVSIAGTGCAVGPQRTTFLESAPGEHSVTADGAVPRAGGGAPSERADGQVVLPTRTCGRFHIVDAWINDLGPYALLLDTGASRTVLSPYAASTAGVDGSIDSMRIGRFLAEGAIPASTLDLDLVSRAIGEPIDGVVGIDVFRDVLLVYDFPENEVRVSRGALSPDEDGVASTLRRSRPHLRAEIGDHAVALLIDTGSTAGLSLRRLDRLPAEGEPRRTGMRARVDGIHIIHSVRLTEDVALGPVVLERPIVRDAVRTNLVGQGVLKEFEVTFDQRRRLVRFERPDAPLDEPLRSPSWYGIGAGFGFEDDDLEVVWVDPDSPAAIAGLRTGDRIQRLNGTTTVSRGCDRWTTTDNGGPRSMVLTVLRGDELVEVAVETDVLVP